MDLCHREREREVRVRWFNLYQRIFQFHWFYSILMSRRIFITAINFTDLFLLFSFTMKHSRWPPCEWVVSICKVETNVAWIWLFNLDSLDSLFPTCREALWTFFLKFRVTSDRDSPVPDISTTSPIFFFLHLTRVPTNRTKNISFFHSFIISRLLSIMKSKVGFTGRFVLYSFIFIPARDDTRGSTSFVNRNQTICFVTYIFSRLL